jgi:hypothetical protein
MADHQGLGFDEQRRAIESMLKSVLGHVQYDYLSGPITGGPRFVRWQTTVGQEIESDEKTYSLLLKRQVIDPNIQDLIGHADRLRADHRHIIEPGSFESPASSWAQQEFYRFWEGVITERAKNVIFIDGWHLSVGCTYEYLCAVRANKNTIDERGQTLGVPAAIRLIEESGESLRGSSAMERHKSKLLAMRAAISFAHSERANA